jgi:uncharacterized membrane protein
MVIAALAAATLILFAALTIDIGLVWSSRTQSQNADDAAALAAAANMIDPAGPTVTLANARQAARATAAANGTVGNAAVNVRNSDITFGDWNLETGEWIDCADQSDPNCITAARVNVTMGGVNPPNVESPAFLASWWGGADSP